MLDTDVTEEESHDRSGSNTGLAIMVAGLVLAAVLIVVSFVILLNKEGSDRQAFGESALSNCQQIEKLKESVRKSEEEELVQLPLLSYFKKHPRELADALLATETAISRLAPRNCYTLPAVKAANIKHPQQNQRPAKAK